MLQARGSEDWPRAERAGNMLCFFVKLFGPSDAARNCCVGVKGLHGPSEAAAGLRAVRGVIGGAFPPRSIAIAEAPAQEEFPKRPCWRAPRSSAAAVGARPRAVFQSISVVLVSCRALGATGASEASSAALLCRRLNPAPEPDGVDGAFGGAVGTRGTGDSSSGGGGERACEVRAGGFSGATTSAGVVAALPGRTGLPGRADDLEPGGLTGIRVSNGGAAGGASTGADGFIELGSGAVGASGAEGCAASSSSLAGPITETSALFKLPLATPCLRSKAVCASKPLAATDGSVRARCSAISSTARANLPLEAPSANT